MRLAVGQSTGSGARTSGSSGSVTLMRLRPPLLDLAGEISPATGAPACAWRSLLASALALEPPDLEVIRHGELDHHPGKAQGEQRRDPEEPRVAAVVVEEDVERDHRTDDAHQQAGNDH